MFKNLSYLIIIVFTLSFSTTYSLYAETNSSDSEVGIILLVKGKSKIISSDGEIRKAAPSAKIFVGDRIETGKNAFLQANFIDGTALRLAGNTDYTVKQFHFDEEKGEALQVNSVDKGTLSFIAGKISKIAPKQFQLHTATATIGIRGSGANVQASETETIVQSSAEHPSIVFPFQSTGEGDDTIRETGSDSDGMVLDDQTQGAKISAPPVGSDETPTVETQTFAPGEDLFDQEAENNSKAREEDPASAEEEADQTEEEEEESEDSSEAEADEQEAEAEPAAATEENAEEPALIEEKEAEAVVVEQNDTEVDVEVVEPESVELDTVITIEVPETDDIVANNLNENKDETLAEDKSEVEASQAITETDDSSPEPADAYDYFVVTNVVDEKYAALSDAEKTPNDSNWALPKIYSYETDTFESLEESINWGSSNEIFSLSEDLNEAQISDALLDQFEDSNSQDSISHFDTYYSGVTFQNLNASNTDGPVIQKGLVESITRVFDPEEDAYIEKAFIAFYPDEGTILAFESGEVDSENSTFNGRTFIYDLTPIEMAGVEEMGEREGYPFYSTNSQEFEVENLLSAEERGLIPGSLWSTNIYTTGSDADTQYFSSSISRADYYSEDDLIYAQEEINDINSHLNEDETGLRSELINTQGELDEAYDDIDAYELLLEEHNELFDAAINTELSYNALQVEQDSFEIENLQNKINDVEEDISSIQDDLDTNNEIISDLTDIQTLTGSGSISAINLTIIGILNNTTTDPEELSNLLAVANADRNKQLDLLSEDFFDNTEVTTLLDEIHLSSELDPNDSQNENAAAALALNNQNAALALEVDDLKENFDETYSEFGLSYTSNSDISAHQVKLAIHESELESENINLAELNDVFVYQTITQVGLLSEAQSAFVDATDNYSGFLSEYGFNDDDLKELLEDTHSDIENLSMNISELEDDIAHYEEELIFANEAFNDILAILNEGQELTASGEGTFDDYYSETGTLPEATIARIESAHSIGALYRTGSSIHTYDDEGQSNIIGFTQGIHLDESYGYNDSYLSSSFEVIPYEYGFGFSLDEPLQLGLSELQVSRDQVFINKNAFFAGLENYYDSDEETIYINSDYSYIAAVPGLNHLKHVGWGIWSMQSEDTNIEDTDLPGVRSFGYLSLGNLNALTPASIFEDLSINTAATSIQYSGSAMGSFFNVGDLPHIEFGTAQITLDFYNNSFSGSLQFAQDSVQLGNLSGGNSQVYSAHIPEGIVPNITGNASLNNGDANGVVQMLPFGDAAEELGGTFRVQNDDRRGIGAFGVESSTDIQSLISPQVQN